MGNFISRTKLVVGGAYVLNKFIGIVLKRIDEGPGTPVPNPTLPFWTIPQSDISSEGKEIPAYADVVVIGSGITGTSFAYNALKLDESLKIVMLEARSVCSGATGRNGGHVNPPLYHDYKDLKDEFGADVAKKNIHFRLSHLREFLTIAQAEGIVKQSQCRRPEHFDVYFDKEEYEEVKASLQVWKAEMPEESCSWVSVDGPEAASKFGFAETVVGCIHGSGGAMHPYRFVTAILRKLLDRHNNFFVATQSPCTAIQAPTPSRPLYTLTTPNGQITTPHIVHATNGWSPHLVVPMRSKIIPLRGTMSAQRPGSSLTAHTLDGMRSYIFNTGVGYDYLTQLPTGEHELMFGGGAASRAIMSDVACSDDSQYSLLPAAHVSGNLPLMFGLENWGRELIPDGNADNNQDGVKWSEGRIKACWSGILGMSADGTPWVGRLPPRISGRAEPPLHIRPRVPPQSYPDEKNQKQKYLPTATEDAHTARPGEWIAAGYTGEGMPQAWMSAKALAFMVLDREHEIASWFPENLRVTEERWKKADVADYLMKKLA